MVSTRSTLKLVPSGLMLTRFAASISRLIGCLTGPLQVTKVPLAGSRRTKPLRARSAEGLANRDDANAEAPRQLQLAGQLGSRAPLAR